jgi:small subunit ribosomal protein S1
MAAHHVEAPEQVVTPGEELWVKIIDIDLERRRISLSIKQAAEGGEVAAEYREFYGEHAYDAQGNYIGPDYTEGEEGAEGAPPAPPVEGAPVAGAEAEAPVAEAAVAEIAAEPVAEVASEPAVAAEPAAE